MTKYQERKGGAREGNRTPTLLREPDFESGASTNSATRAHLILVKTSIPFSQYFTLISLLHNA